MGRILTKKGGVSLFLLFCVHLAFSQVNAVLMTSFDTAAYDALPIFNEYTGRKGGDGARRVDLRTFCPLPGNQGMSGSCAGFALGYGAMSVHLAIDSNWTDPRRVDKSKFSATFIYNQIKKKPGSCDEPTSMTEAIKFTRQKGNCPSSVFERLDDCSAKPNEAQLAIAAKYKIRDAGTIFDREARPDGKVQVIKNYLRDSIPIIAFFEAWQSFQELNPQNSLWSPKKNQQDDSYMRYHYLLIVGFDDDAQTFDVFNSWGPNWGDNGFGRVTYKDMGKYCHGAYRVLFSDKTSVWKHRLPEEPAPVAMVRPAGPSPENAPKADHKNIEKPIRTTQNEPTVVDFWFGGSFEFFNITEDGRQEPEAVVFDRGQQVYRLKKGAAHLGDRFQLSTTDLSAGYFAYVFSCDPEGSTKLHFPKNDRPAWSPGERAVVTLPSAQSVLALRKKGTDYLCILYSNAPIDRINDRMKLLRNGDLEIFKKSLNVAFGDVLAHSTNLDFADEKMRVHGKGVAAKTVVLPIVLQVQTIE